MPILSETEELSESIRKMERRLNKETDQATVLVIVERLTKARDRLAEIESQDEALHQQALAQHRQAQREAGLR